MNKKVSIIIPVYNVGKYIRRCLESIAAQDFDFFETIIINDGSTDNSQAIIDEFLERYPDVFKCIKIKNNGVANARNVGIRNAEGDYIAFVDGDDYIADNMLSTLYNKALQENSDVIVGGYVRKSKYRNADILPSAVMSYPKSVKEDKELLIYNAPYIWNKLFRRAFIIENQIKFENLRIFEDLLFTHECFLMANKISAVNEIVYYYIVGSSNSVSSNYSEKMFDIFLAAKILKEFCRGNNIYEENEEYIIAVILNHIFLRLETPVIDSLVESQMRFLREGFSFLDDEFSKWRENEVYFRIKKKNKKLYLDESYWEQEIRKSYSARRICKYLNNVINKVVK